MCQKGFISKVSIGCEGIYYGGFFILSFSEKEEQYEYLTSVEKRKQDEYEARIDELEQEQAKAQVTKIFSTFLFKFEFF